ncbi:MAG: HD domain-containing protein [Gemmatimonadetes bacterium]|nr:HD domain-containing protein [Gemmatimonadota bacterium]NIR77962.1 HD domain-containing protein [Gemmatimonadota bacterium]NIT87232.1 HD domain-containing protein [Gemmatimonadota bacterium]NIU31075.1 HD domain-containing protein [Gemmatimonadota bacterium]NIU35811.1 HD domain-containing protein [Gemmatimonadota bacterium]
MAQESRSRVVRDPLWNTIRLDATAVRIVDTAAFQRLRYIRQLGFAHLVYPGATHTRFDHALGVYHLTVTALRLLRERSDAVPEEAFEGAHLVPYAALLHDIGHYAFSHALEELEPERVPGDHEAVSARFFESPELEEAISSLGPDAGEQIYALIRGESAVPLRGLVSGSLDLDKMEYLRRDARFCGVPYGEVDVDRLLQGLVLLRDPATGLWEVGVDEKAVSALESLLFAKYQMFRNVYWHHAVRAATALYKRIVEEAVRAGILSPEELVGPTDEELVYELGERAGAAKGEVGRRLAERWLPALKNRKLPKRALELTAAEIGERSLPEWLVGDSPRKRRLEDGLARELELGPGEVVVDFPAKRAMFQLDLLIRRRSGEVQRLGRGGLPGVIDLPRVAEELYRTARVLRVFTFRRRRMTPERLLELLGG